MAADAQQSYSNKVDMTRCFLQYLDMIRQFVHENLRHMAHAPSIQMQDVPPDMIDLDNLEADDSTNPDVRFTPEQEERR